MDGWNCCRLFGCFRCFFLLRDSPSLVLSRKLLVCGTDGRSGLPALWGSEACDLENVLLWPQGGALAPLKRPGWWGRGRGAEGGGAVVRKGAGLLPSIVVISRVRHL